MHENYRMPLLGVRYQVFLLLLTTALHYLKQTLREEKEPSIIHKNNAMADAK